MTDNSNNNANNTASNNATELLLASLANATVYDLSQPFHAGMPQSPNHPPFQRVLVRRHGDVVRSDGGSAANDLLSMGTHVGTHVDALCHVSHEGLLCGGVNAADVMNHSGFSMHGVEQIAPFVGRGVFLDVAALHGRDVLAPGEAVTGSDLSRACERQGVEVRPGDAVLIGTGWSRHWADRAAFEGQRDGAPGPDESAGQWLVDRKVRFAGGETVAFERIAAHKGHATLPVHRMLLVDAGVNIIETMKLDELAAAEASTFLFILSPLALVGATGSPVRPLAVVTGNTVRTQ